MEQDFSATGSGTKLKKSPTDFSALVAQRCDSSDFGHGDIPQTALAELI
jgi:hypothetical protein